MSNWPGDPRREITSFGSLNRSALMSRVRSVGNASTEERMATLLRAAQMHGWRRHTKLLGKPDFCWFQERIVVFIDGCFWHGHRCGKNLRPKKNAQLWISKLEATRLRDRRITRQLRAEGWVVLRFWECLLKKRPQSCVDKIACALARQ